MATGAEIYPHREDLEKRKFWACFRCDAYVGCHRPKRWSDPGITPLGTLANGQLRKLRAAAHSVFDPIWQSGKMTRTEAYEWASAKLGTPKEQTHIGMFDERACSMLIEICRGGL